jgi:transcriptional regulator with XRE-family HTH domain
VKQDVSHFGRNVRIMRMKKGWQTQFLADFAGVAAPTVSSVENGRHNPGLDTAVRLATALGTDVSTLLAPPEE